MDTGQYFNNRKITTTIELIETKLHYDVLTTWTKRWMKGFRKYQFYLHIRIMYRYHEEGLSLKSTTKTFIDEFQSTTWKIIIKENKLLNFGSMSMQINRTIFSKFFKHMKYTGKLNIWCGRGKDNIYRSDNNTNLIKPNK